MTDKALFEKRLDFRRYVRARNLIPFQEMKAQKEPVFRLFVAANKRRVAEFEAKYPDFSKAYEEL